MTDDASLNNPPQFDYSVKIPDPRTGSIKAPLSQSTTWPVDNPKPPLIFTFLLFQRLTSIMQTLMVQILVTWQGLIDN
ncbi:MAG TPA: hypothetical protein VH500_16670 [Nitrososphaeraceae archaeon]